MSNESGVAVAPPKLVLPATIAELTPIQKGWLLKAQQRTVLFADLTREELEIQGLLLELDKETDYEKVKERLTKAKQIAEASKQRRTHFTNQIKEMLFDTAMAFEKRNYLLLTGQEDGKGNGGAIAIEFKLRKAAEEAAAAGAKKSKEIADLTAHIQNENFRIAATYRQDLRKIIAQGYQQCLKGKTSGQYLIKYKQDLVKLLETVTLSKFVAFERLLVSKEEAVEIFKSIEPYKAGEDLKDAITNIIPEMFAMYGEDLKNAEAALQHAAEEESRLALETKKEIENNTAVNNLTAEASAGGFVMTGGAPAVKRKLELVTANTISWELSVLKSYILNYNPCQEFIKVKDREKLSVGQMAAALGKVATENKIPRQAWESHYPGLTLKEIEK